MRKSDSESPRRSARNTSRAGKKLLMSCGASCTLAMALVFALLAYAAWQFESGAWPDTAVTAGEDLPDFVTNLLLENQILEPGEEILYFYSLAITDYLGDGNVLTDRRVISYSRSEDGMLFSAARFAEVERIESDYAQGALEDTALTVETEDGAIHLLLSTENGGDRVFVAELERRVAQEN